MTLHTCTECVFDVDADWVDGTAYAYANGDVRVTTGRFTSRSDWAGKLDKAIETFGRGAAKYELVERTRLERPAPGAEILAHRFGGNLNRFELNLFWPLDDDIWVCRVRGPWDSEDVCRQVIDRFIETYEPVGEIEAP